MNTPNNNHVQKLLRRATKADVIEAAKLTSEYYQNCSRAGVQGDHFAHTLADALHLVLTDRHHHTRDGGVYPDEPRRDYSANYEDRF